MAIDCSSGIQQAGDWTVDNQSILCFHSNQIDFHSILCDVDYHTVLYLSLNHGGIVVALFRSVDEDWECFQNALFISIALAGGVLFVEFQMDF